MAGDSQQEISESDGQHYGRKMSEEIPGESFFFIH